MVGRIALTIVLFGIAIGLFIWFLYWAVQTHEPNLYTLVSCGLVLGLAIFTCFGYFTLQPNEARVLMLFGAYRGTVRRAAGAGRIR